MQTVESVTAFKSDLETNPDLYHDFKITMAEAFKKAAIENGLILNDGPEDVEKLHDVAIEAADTFLKTFIATP